MVEQWVAQAIAFMTVNWQIVVGIIVLLLVGSGLLQDLRARESVLQSKLELMQKSLHKEMTGIRSMAEEQSVRDREVFQVGLYNFNESVARIMGEMNRTQQAQFDTFSGQLHAATRVTEEQIDKVKDAVDERLGRFAEMLNESMGRQGQCLEDVSRRLDQSVTDSGQLMDEMQGTLEKNLQQMRVNNQHRMQQLQTKPDHDRLETCLNVSAQLDQAAQGLNELQLMAGGSLDVSRVLNHLKMRGPWAEVGAEELLDAVLSVNQYRTQVAVRPQSSEKADFAVVLPSTQEDRPVYLPILTSFPAQENALLMYALERQDPAAIEAASKALEQALRAQAHRIRGAFVEPPFTTDYAILYLPTEGLYAQMVQDGALREELQQQYRLLLSGPSTMASLLGSLQAGLRAHVMEQRAKELRVSLGQARERLEKLYGSAGSEQGRPAPPPPAVEERRPPAPEQSSRLESERRRFEQLFGHRKPQEGQPRPSRPVELVMPRAPETPKAQAMPPPDEQPKASAPIVFIPPPSSNADDGPDKDDWD